MSAKIDSRLKELGITLPEATAPAANYVPFVISGNMVHISGQLPMTDGKFVTGRLGDGSDIDEGAAAARLCAIALMAQLKAATGGDLDRVARVVKLTGFVNSAPDFYNQPAVVNGASDLMVSVFGEAGRHARSSVGIAALPFGAIVEVEGIFELA